MYCSACSHTCSPAAYDIPADYEALYAADYAQQQIDPLQDNAKWHMLALQPTYLAFFNRCGRGRGRSVLDIGCGAGRFLLAARGRGWQVRGIEPARPAVQCARSLGLPVEQATAGQLAGSGAQFDAVTLFDVVEHVPEPLGLLTQALPLLKPGGDLFVTVPNWDCSLMSEATRADWMPPVHLQFFTPASLRHLAERAGGQARPALQVLAAGYAWTDPRPPLTLSFEQKRRILLRPWLKWAYHRLRGRPNWAAQLWLHARKK